MSLILLWLSTVKQPSPCVPGAHVEKDESDPPPKQGGYAVPKSRCNAVACLYSVRMTGRSRPHLSLREGSEKPPFSLALYRAESVLAVKGPLRRFAPWTAPGRSERRAVHEGKGGVRAVGRGGRVASPLVHDKGYYHS